MFLKAGQRPTSSGYHCLVIGSGPAGMTVALRLAEAGKRVLVIESGHGEGDILPSVGYGHFSGSYWNAHSIRALGGTSNAWTGWTSPLRAIDFDHPSIGISWPMTLDELLPYYRLAAPLLDRHPSTVDFQGQAVLPGWRYHPFSVEAPTRFGEKYQKTIASSATLDVAVGCSVISLDANAGRTLVGALACYDHAAGVPFDIPLTADQAVVLAGGGVGNAQLLLQPRTDGTPTVGNESGLAGKFLMEHPHVYGAGDCVVSSDLDRLRPPARFGRLVDAIALDAAVEVERGLFGCSLNFYHKNQDHPFVPVLSRPGVPFFHYQVDVRSEMQPTLANHVFLTAERSRSGAYRPAARCVFSAGDLVNIDRTMRALGETLIRLNRGRVRLNNDALYRETTGGGHIMGTTRMGRTRRDSVVDRDCRVHGYDNFFVAGSSVFPSGGFVNPTLTIVALAARLADEIARRG
jgi:hypothetical protein